MSKFRGFMDMNVLCGRGGERVYNSGKGRGAEGNTSAYFENNTDLTLLSYAIKNGENIYYNS